MQKRTFLKKHLFKQDQTKMVSQHFSRSLIRDGSSVVTSEQADKIYMKFKNEAMIVGALKTSLGRQL